MTAMLLSRLPYGTGPPTALQLQDGWMKDSRSTAVVRPARGHVPASDTCRGRKASQFACSRGLKTNSRWTAGQLPSNTALDCRPTAGQHRVLHLPGSSWVADDPVEDFPHPRVHVPFPVQDRGNNDRQHNVHAVMHPASADAECLREGQKWDC